VLCEIDFLCKNNCRWVHLFVTFFVETSYILNLQICTSLNHRKKNKTKPCSLIPQKLAANLKLLIVEKFWC